MSILIPHWFEGLDLETLSGQRARNQFFMRQAALYATQEGNRDALAKVLKVSPVTIYFTYAQRDDRKPLIAPELAKKIERLLGSDVMPAKLLRPDFFEEL